MDQWLKNKAGTDYSGCVALIGHGSEIIYHKSYGEIEKGTGTPMPLNAIFDLESITKVVATSWLALDFHRNKKINLDDSVVKYIPEFAGEGKDVVTLRHLATYTSGLSDGDMNFEIEKSKEGIAKAWKKMFLAPLHFKPGTKYQYSDLGYRILGKALEKSGGDDLNDLCRKYLWSKLGMTNTFYNPDNKLKDQIAGHEKTRGLVEDIQDLALGGVVGCDGAFSDAHDLSLFCQMILSDSKLTAEMTTPIVADLKYEDTNRMQNLLFAPKGLGWELKTEKFSIGGTKTSGSSFGKAGGGGSFIWIDPKLDCYGILLTNHGLPKTFDGAGWVNLLNKVEPFTFFDQMVEIVGSR